MNSDTWSPHDVAAALRGVGDDEDGLRIDVALHLPHLAPLDRELLRLYGDGYSPREAGNILGISNGQRAFEIALRELTAHVNGIS